MTAVDTVRGALRQRKIARLEREADRQANRAASLPLCPEQGHAKHEATRLRIAARELRGETPAR